MEDYIAKMNVQQLVKLALRLEQEIEELKARVEELASKPNS